MSLGRVLVIDDHKEEHFFVGKCFERVAPDVEVTSCFYAKDALDLLSKDPKRFELILLDLSMPRMTGFEFIDAYVSLPPSKRLGQRVVMVSASIDPAEQMRAKSHAAVFDILHKPLQDQTLSWLLERLKFGHWRA